jgi:hypothetical protein
VDSRLSHGGRSHETRKCCDQQLLDCFVAAVRRHQFLDFDRQPPGLSNRP